MLEDISITIIERNNPLLIVVLSETLPARTAESEILVDAGVTISTDL